MADRCKFEKYQYQVSYDNGSTWDNVTPIQIMKGNIIEYMSADCSEIETLYRWVDLEGTYICDGNNKYTRQIQEESYDAGVSWYTSYPTVYRQGTFIGVDDEYCADKFIGHYIPSGDAYGDCPRNYIWNGSTCVYVDPLKVVKCNGNPTLTSGETKYYVSSYPLISAEIGNCVTSIGYGAFYNCTSLTSCTISSGVTTINPEAFGHCYSLSSITIPNTVTSIGSNAFETSRLSSIEIPDSVTSIGEYAFYNCYHLTSCTIGNGVTTIGEGAFYECGSLSSVTIGSGVTSIGSSAFYNTDIKSMTIKATTPPTLGDSVFAYVHFSSIYVPCESINAYRTANGWSNYVSKIQGIPPCETPPIETKFLAHYSDSSTYTAACDSNINLTTATTRAHSTSYTAMTSCEIGECIGTIGDDAFRNCSGLTSCIIGSYVTKIRIYAFENCYSLSSITIPDSVTSIGSYAFSNCSGLTSCTIGSGVTYIGNYAFWRCTSLRSITIPDSVTEIGDDAFSGCTSLRSITVAATTPPTLGSGAFSNTNNCPIYVPCESINAYRTANRWSDYASRIMSLDCAFPIEAVFNVTSTSKPTRIASGTTNLVMIKVSGLNKPISTGYTFTTFGNNTVEYALIGGTTGDKAFYGCSAMTSIEISDNVTTIGASAFTDCSSITSCTIGTSVTTIGASAFKWCYGITDIDLPNTVNSIGNYAFQSCTGLTNIRLSNNLVTIPQGCFWNCDSMSSITIPSGVTTIGESAFTYCDGLSNVNFEESSELQEISQGAFRNCSGLTSITIPDNITNIGYGAFFNCSGLTSITVAATTPPALGSNAFYNTNNCPIYVPATSVNTYKSASGWSNYTSRIQAIPT